MKEATKLRADMRGNFIPQWRVCEKIGISEPTLIRWLRNLTPEKESLIQSAVNELIKEREA